MHEYTLNNGVKIPAVGMGTWPLRGRQLEKIMEIALSFGYELFDTADNYSNEDAIGNVIERHKQERGKFFIMTKISDEKSHSVNAPWSSIGKYFYKASPYMRQHSAGEVVNMLVEASLSKLKTDYIDCLIMHWPYPDYFLEIYDAMIQLYQKGILRSIGVSNCRQRHLELIKENFSVMPAVNQICVSPLDTRESLLQYCNKEGIRVVCYAPLMMMNRKEFKDSEIVSRLTSKYGISAGQLLLLWNHSQGIIPIPKSTKEERLKENSEVDRISLTSEDMAMLASLNKDFQYLPESLYCPGL